MVNEICSNLGRTVRQPIKTDDTKTAAGMINCRKHILLAIIERSFQADNDEAIRVSEVWKML